MLSIGNTILRAANFVFLVIALGLTGSLAGTTVTQSNLQVNFGVFASAFALLTSSFYGIWDPPALPTLILLDAYDPTERLSSSVTLIAPPGSDAADGMTFSVSDGTQTVILEYDDPALRNGSTAS